MLHHRNLDTSQPSGSGDPAPPLLSLAQAWLRFGSGSLRFAQICSGLLTLFTRRAVVKTHLTRNRQLLTRGPKGAPSQGPESVTMSCLPSQPSSHPSSLLSLQSLSHLSSKTFLSPSHSRYLHPRMQNSAHHEHRARKKGMLKKTGSRQADRGSPGERALRGQVWGR